MRVFYVSSNRLGGLCFPYSTGLLEGWCDPLEHQGTGCPQQRGQQQQSWGAPRGDSLAGVGATAACLFTPQLLTEDASVGGRAQAAHVVVTGPSILAVQELIVADISCRTRGGRGRGGKAESI